ncbi:MAG TPA: phosphotransferase family protein [Thermoanaerobaculia bacterium]|nr:phosphotransferase family protein [Thermoanaerobaculia bacterium]
MELSELEPKLVVFGRAMYDDPHAEVRGVHKMPGHAGFSYGFTVESRGTTESWYLRLPPPNVRWVGTADVLRQVAVLNALDGTAVPHCSVRWSGDDLRWFGCPYFVVPKLEGRTMAFIDNPWLADLDREARWSMGRQAMTALAELHRVDWRQAPYLGDPIPLDDDVTRWDRFMPKVAEPERLRAAPEVRQLLLARLPAKTHVGIFHGDFQWSNLFYSSEGKLLAVIDWELVGVGATLNDVGWIATFNDAGAWSAERKPSTLMPHADELVAMYVEAWGSPVEHLDWFRALAAYKFAIISGFNLALHRRGKREDPVWETTALSIEPLLERARQLLQI